MEKLRIKIITSGAIQLNDMEIYRYFTYEKLYRLLNDKTLWFSNTGEFLDKKERQCYNDSVQRH